MTMSASGLRLAPVELDPTKEPAPLGWWIWCDRVRPAHALRRAPPSLASRGVDSSTPRPSTPSFGTTRNRNVVSQNEQYLFLSHRGLFHPVESTLDSRVLVVYDTITIYIVFRNTVVGLVSDSSGSQIRHFPFEASARPNSAGNCTHRASGTLKDSVCPGQFHGCGAPYVSRR